MVVLEEKAAATLSPLSGCTWEGIGQRRICATQDNAQGSVAIERDLSTLFVIEAVFPMHSHDNSINMLYLWPHTKQACF